MTRSTSALLVLAVYCVALVGIAAWGTRRTHTANDFFLASRRMGAWLVALSHVANASPLWLLFVIAGAAFAWGLAAVWICVAVIGGYVLNTFYVAPRLRALSVGQGSVTLVQVLSAGVGDRLQPLVVRSAALILGICLLLEIGAVLHTASNIVASGFGFDATTFSITAMVVIVAATLVGGYWSTSLNDAVQVGLVLLMVALTSSLALLVRDDLEQFKIALEAIGPTTTDWFGGRTGVTAVAFVAGVAGFGFALPGQPHAVQRFMGARDERTLGMARWIALSCIVLLLGGMLLSGWNAAVLYAGLEIPEQAVLVLVERALPPQLSAIIITLLLCVLLAAIANRLLVLASSLAADLKRPTAQLSFEWARVVLVLCAIVALCFALYARDSLLNLAMFAFSALGAAFGPLLLVLLAGKRVRPGSTLGAMWAGFTLTLLFHVLPDAPGDFLERVLPFVAALGIALTGGERRRNPDRADRAEQTVHDRMPI